MNNINVLFQKLIKTSSYISFIRGTLTWIHPDILSLCILFALGIVPTHALVFLFEYNSAATGHRVYVYTNSPKIIQNTINSHKYYFSNPFFS